MKIYKIKISSGCIAINEYVKYKPDKEKILEIVMRYTKFLKPLDKISVKISEIDVEIIDETLNT